jgi:hypothetical protein
MTPIGTPPKISQDRVLSGGWGTAEYRNEIYEPFPWDGWKNWAMANGVPEGLATLGRAVIRVAFQNAWDDRLKALCGWRDDGKGMLRAAMKYPEDARRSG